MGFSMRASRHRIRIRTVGPLLFAIGLLIFLLLLSLFDRKQRVVLSDGSCLIVRKVSYGKDNIYYHNAVQRTVAALVPKVVRDRGVFDWLPKVGVSSANSQIL